MKQINKSETLLTVGWGLAILLFMGFYMYFVRNMPLDW